MEISFSICSLSTISTTSASSIAGRRNLPIRPNPTCPPAPTTKLSFWFDDDEEAAPVEERLGANFLDECGICGRRLGAGREAYMYGGEEAFCSEECRLERMEMDAAVERVRRMTTALRCTSRRTMPVCGGERALVVG